MRENPRLRTLHKANMRFIMNAPSLPIHCGTWSNRRMRTTRHLFCCSMLNIPPNRFT